MTNLNRYASALGTRDPILQTWHFIHTVIDERRPRSLAVVLLTIASRASSARMERNIYNSIT